MHSTSKKSIIRDKSYSFALRIIQLRKYLVKQHKDYVLSDQVLRSGTSIGAQVHEAEHAQSRADFIHKMSIALKEANETRYWLLLLKDSDYITEEMFLSIKPDIDELIKILVSIIKTSKTRKY